MNNQEISKDDFAGLVDRVRPFVTTESFFEVMTVLGFLYFADNHVDFSVIEVGLGGRLDSTNVVQSTLSVITNISLEHTPRLGKSEQEIAREKAGIIKENSICVTAATGEALSVIREICQEKNTELVCAKPTAAYDLSLQGEINSFIGRKFEKVCQQFLHYNPIFAFNRIGKEWGNMPAGESGKDTYEIDLCAVNEKTKEILFGECKWQSKVDAQVILRELQKKASYVQWFDKQRKEYYVLFAKSFRYKNIDEKNVFLFDLT